MSNFTQQKPIHSSLFIQLKSITNRRREQQPYQINMQSGLMSSWSAPLSHNSWQICKFPIQNQQTGYLHSKYKIDWQIQCSWQLQCSLFKYPTQQSILIRLKQWGFNQHDITVQNTEILCGQNMKQRCSKIFLLRMHKCYKTILLICMFGLLIESSYISTIDSSILSVGKENVILPYKPKKISQIFLELPHPSELQLMIQSVDPVALSKLVKLLNQNHDEYGCASLQKYMEDLNQQIRKAINQKQKATSIQKSLVQAATNQIQLLSKTKQALQKKSLQLSDQLDQYRDDILSNSNQVTEMDRHLRYFQSNLSQINAVMLGFRVSLRTINQRINNQRELVIAAQLDLSTHDFEIERLEKKLAQIKQRRYLAQRYHNQTLESLQQMVKTKNNYTTTISENQQKIKQLSLKIDTTKVKKLHVEIDMQSQRQALPRISRKLLILQQQIKVIKQYLSQKDVFGIMKKNQALQSALSEIQTLTIFRDKFREMEDQFGEQCFEEKLFVPQLQNIIVFAGTDSILQYLASNYGAEYKYIELPQSNQSQLTLYTELKPKYFPYSNYRSQCLKGPVSGYGRIISIAENNIEIICNQQNLKLIITGCTTIESFRGQFEIGSKILFLGRTSNYSEKSLELSKALTL